MFPGATKVSAHEYEIREDVVATGDYGLKVVYQLPADVRSTEIFDYLRSGALNDWTVADDRTCADTDAGMAQPPPYTRLDVASQSTVPPAASVLILGRSNLTFLPPPASNLRSGVTFSLLREGDSKFVTLDEAAYTCARLPDVDSQADRFDQL